MNQNKYKLVKNRPASNRLVQNDQGSFNNLSQIVTASSTIAHQSPSAISRSSTVTSNQSFKLINKNINNQSILSQSVQSSNKLDELLKRCREIGTSSSSTHVQPSTSSDSVSSNSTAPITFANLISSKQNYLITYELVQ
jgi:hypothetical protein